MTICGRNALLMLVGIILASIGVCHGQIEPDQFEEVDIIQTELSSVDPQIDTEEIERRDDLRREPLVLNDASREDLCRIPDIPYPIIERLSAWISAGPVRTYDELLAVHGMVPEYLNTLKRYTTLRRRESDVRVRFRSRMELDSRNQAQSETFEGNPWREDSRFTWSAGGTDDVVAMQGDLRMEKDPGEASITDLISGVVQARLHDAGIEITLGNFRFDHGEGVLLRGSRMTRATGDLPGAMIHDGRGIRPAASTDQQSLLRGVGISVRMKQMQIDAFGSNAGRHATVDDSGRFVSLYDAGLFRTPSERARRSAVQERGGGLRCSYELTEELRISGAGALFAFDRESQVTRRKEQSGGLSLAITLKKEEIEFGGEIARDLSGQAGWIGGVHLRLDAGTQIGISVRHYPRTFFTRHGAGLAAGSAESQNEDGMTVVLRLRPWHGWEFGISYDRSRSLESGDAWLLKCPRTALRGSMNWDINERWRMEFSYSEAARELTAEVQGMPLLGTSHKRVFRCTIISEPASSVKLTNRIEWNRSIIPERLSPGSGLLVFQQASVRFSEWLSMHARVSIFETDAYDARMYGVEPGLPGAVVLRMYDGRGSAWAITLRALILDGLACSAKYLHHIRTPRQAAEERPRSPDEQNTAVGIQLDGTLALW